MPLSNTYAPFNSVGAAAALVTSAGNFTFTRASAAYSLDWEGVWVPLGLGEPGFAGARMVKNWFLNSAAPSNWNTLANAPSGANSIVTVSLPDGTIGQVSQYIHVAGSGDKNTLFHLSAQGGSDPGSMRRSLFASRAQLYVAAGGPQSHGIVGRSNGTAIGSESNNPIVLIPASTWTLVGQTGEQFESHTGYSATFGTPTVADETFYVAQIQFEDVSGRKTALAQEYVPSGAAPGVQWFGTQPRTTANWNNPLYGTYDSAGNAISPGGTLTDGAVGAALTGLTGAIHEAAATNLVKGYNAADFAGELVLDNATTNKSGAPGASGASVVYTDARSERCVYNVSDVAVLTNGLQSSATDLTVGGRLRVGHSVWFHVAGIGAQGPFVIQSFTGVTLMTFTTSGLTARALGTATNIHRVPGSGDFISIRYNDLTWYYGTTGGPTTVDIAAIGTATVDGYQHISNTIPLTAALTKQSGSTLNTNNNNQPAFFWNAVDLATSVVVTGGTAPSVTLVEDSAALIAAGLGYLCRNRLVFKLDGGTSGTATFTFPAGIGTVGSKSIVSVFAKRFSGSLSPYVKMSGYGGTTVFTNSSYTRVTSPEVTTVGAGRDAQIVVPNNNVVYAVLMQVEDVVSTGNAFATSPIVTAGAAAGVARAATRFTRPWAVTTVIGTTTVTAWKVNDFGRMMMWTPSAGSVAQKCTLWSAYTDSNNYAELSITGTTITWRKRVAGSNFDVTASLTPVAGTGIVLDFRMSSTAGIALSINGTPATPNANITALGFTIETVEDFGSLAGANVAHGSFSALAPT